MVTTAATGGTPAAASSDTLRPVWLFSLDSEQFHAAPTTTGGLIAWYRAWGSTPAAIDFRQLHFRERGDVAAWIAGELAVLAEEAAAALARGLEPVAGISFYTWNAAEFLELVRCLRAACPGLAIVAGGPHVQQAESYLGVDPIDVIVLGEGEATFQELLDTPRAGWPGVPGIAWLDGAGAVAKSAPRERQRDLARIPSPFDVLELTDAGGRPRYDAVTYETTRGCPYKCAFCEWGTGAIGTKMIGFPMERLRRDWEKIVRAGIPNIWLADSNFGALRDDVEKARLVCELKERHGLPRTFATSWSKKHSPRVQQIVLMLHEHGLLPFYQLALQTLTPRALELCHRENMAANEYEPIAQRMAQAGIPISAELIWGLPGDDLASFERNLDRLLATFPNINIFGYTLLPGTEFHERREEYRIETLPVAGYGKAHGEYVVGCHTFGRAEGEEGYFLITAHVILLSGHVLAYTARWLTLATDVPVGTDAARGARCAAAGLWRAAARARGRRAHAGLRGARNDLPHGARGPVACARGDPRGGHGFRRSSPRCRRVAPRRGPARARRGAVPAPRRGRAVRAHAGLRCARGARGTARDAPAGDGVVRRRAAAAALRQPGRARRGAQHARWRQLAAGPPARGRAMCAASGSGGAFGL